jgi:CHRD domain
VGGDVHHASLYRLESARDWIHSKSGKQRNGGVSVFLCSNAPAPPVPTPLCPATGGSVSGTLAAADVIGPAGQGIEPGEIDELIDAIGAGATYVNVHTNDFPGGEIRGQIGRGFGRSDD